MCHQFENSVFPLPSFVIRLTGISSVQRHHRREFSVPVRPQSKMLWRQEQKDIPPS